MYIAHKIHEAKYNSKQIIWGAIIAGTLVSLGCEALLNFLGVGLGLASLNSQNPQTFNLESGATVWLIVSGMISMGIGGWFVGKFSGVTCAFSRAYHGVIAWSLAALLTILMATTASVAFMGGAINMITIPNSQEPPQELANPQKEPSISNEPSSNTMQQNNPSHEIGSYVGNLGKVSIAIFLAFMMSGIASVTVTIWAGSNTYLKEENREPEF